MNKYEEALEILLFESAYPSRDCYVNMKEATNLLEKAVNDLRELVDKEIELESRKGKLVVGSEWECVAECRAPSQLFKKGQIVSVTSIFIEETVWLFYKHFSEMLKKEYEDETNMPKDQFLLCFKPKGEK